MKRHLPLVTALFFLASTPSLAHAGTGFSCDPSTGVLVINTPPVSAQDEYLVAKAYNGYCRTPDRKQAEAWYIKAAKQGHAEAQYDLAEMYFAGLGVPLDYAAAKQWYLKAAAQGHGGAQLRLGFLYAEKHFAGVTADLKEAEKWFKKAAEQDTKDARFRLGNFYLNYKDPPDIAQGRAWLQKAAEGGHHTAMYDLGRLLMQQKETTAGIGWITKAADAGEMQAQESLVTIFEKGQGVPKNEDEALKWVLRIAAENNAPPFYLDKAGDALFDGTDSMQDNYPAARKFYERAAAKNDPHALRQLALIYRFGLGVKKDAAKAQQFDDRAAAIAP